MINITWNSSSDGVRDTDSRPWTIYLEVAVLSIICILGVLLNIRVMLTSFVGNGYRSAKQKMFLLFGLALSDTFVCCVRGPCLINVRLFRPGMHDEYICAFWIFSFAFILLAMVTNTVIALQRRKIVYAYQRYLSTFTSRRMLIFTVLLWSGVAVVLVPCYIALQVYGRISTDSSVCHVYIGRVPLDKTAALVVRAAIAFILGIAPICVLCLCYASIIWQIFRTGLLQLERVDESACYRRVLNISLGRLILVIVGWIPYLIYVVLAPLFPNMYAHAHYLDILVIVQAALSPLITMQDAEFRDQVGGIHKKRYWSMFGRSKRTPRELSDHITSANMKTQGVLQD